MLPEFEQWSQLKQSLHSHESHRLFKEGEIWWCRLGMNIGDEQNGKVRSFSRPVLVFRKFNSRIFIGIPLSTQIKEKHYYHTLHFKGRAQSAVLSQIRLMDAKRLENKMGKLPLSEFQKLSEILQKLLFKNTQPSNY